MADFDRPLTTRGKRAARRMGAEVARRGWVPAAILCSPAARTRATLAAFDKGCAEADGPPLPAARFDPDLYLAEALVWLGHVQAQSRKCKSVLLIGHNPGLQELALALTGTAGKGLHDRLKKRFPTCALAVIRFDASDWSSVAPGDGRLQHLLFPRELEKA